MITLTQAELDHKISERAYEIYEWRCEHEEEGTALGDYLEAKRQILDELLTRPPQRKVL